MELDQSSIPFIFIGIVILCGNLFVCVLYYQHGVLHTVANKFVVSFAACDMMIALLFIPMYIFSNNFSSYIAALSSFGSLLNLLALTYERNVAIFHALRYHEILCRKKIRLLMVEVWSSTLIITLFPLPWEIKLSTIAFMKWRRVYSGILTAIITVVIIITSFVYIRIFKVNRYHMKKERELARFTVSDSRFGSSKRSKKSISFMDNLIRLNSSATMDGKKSSENISTAFHSSGFDGRLIEQETELCDKVSSLEEEVQVSGDNGQNRHKRSETADEMSDREASGRVERVREDCAETQDSGHTINHPNTVDQSSSSGNKATGRNNRSARNIVTMLSHTGLNSYHKFQTAKSILREIKAARVIGLIFALNCLCWLPIIIINFCDVIAPDGQAAYISPTFIKASLYLFVLNSMINPFLYALFKKDFRKVISRRLRVFKLQLTIK